MIILIRLIFFFLLFSVDEHEQFQNHGFVKKVFFVQEDYGLKITDRSFRTEKSRRGDKRG